MHFGFLKTMMMLPALPVSGEFIENGMIRLGTTPFSDWMVCGKAE